MTKWEEKKGKKKKEIAFHFSLFELSKGGVVFTRGLRGKRGGMISYSQEN